jgi:hypothetical protein
LTLLSKYEGYPRLCEFSVVVGEIVVKFDTKIVYLVLLQVYVYLNHIDAPF